MAPWYHVTECVCPTQRPPLSVSRSFNDSQLRINQQVEELPPTELLVLQHLDQQILCNC